MNAESPAIMAPAAENPSLFEGKKGAEGDLKRPPLPFENELRAYLHGSISRETAERKRLTSLRWLCVHSFLCVEAQRRRQTACSGP